MLPFLFFNLLKLVEGHLDFKEEVNFMPKVLPIARIIHLWSLFILVDALLTICHVYISVQLKRVTTYHPLEPNNRTLQSLHGSFKFLWLHQAIGWPLFFHAHAHAHVCDPRLINHA